MKIPKLGKVKNVVIIYRPMGREPSRIAKELSAWLSERNIKAYSYKQTALTNLKNLPKNKSLKSIDLVIVLGGDGTYLKAVHLISELQIPILGVNLGSLGFLTENRKEDLYEIVDMTLAGHMQMRPRTMMKIKVMKGRKVILNDQALNEIVLERGAKPTLLSFEIKTQSDVVSTMKADGLIVATPTGSTAYNLAAGGPILHPASASFVATPICAHSLTNRPIIFPDQIEMQLTLIEPKTKALLSIDGQKTVNVDSDHTIFISRSKSRHFILRRPSHNYFELLREKLKFGER